MYAATWVLLPLRAFLGGTFVYAGMQKLADRHFFDPASPSSVQSQMRAYARLAFVNRSMTPTGVEHQEQFEQEPPTSSEPINDADRR